MAYKIFIKFISFTDRILKFHLKYYNWNQIIKSRTSLTKRKKLKSLLLVSSTNPILRTQSLHRKSEPTEP